MPTTENMGFEDQLGKVSKIDLLQNVMDAAEVLSMAMVESEAKGANYDMIDEPWQHLTAAIQFVYSSK